MQSNLLRRSFLAFTLILAAHSMAFATWSILAVDSATGQIIVASATCLRQSVFPGMGAKDLRDIQAVAVSGKGVAVCQAAIETTRKNQQTIFRNSAKGPIPSESLRC